MMERKHATSLRLTTTAKRLLKETAQRLGNTQQGVLELAIREFAHSHGIKTKATGK